MLFKLAMKYENDDKNNWIPTQRGYDVKPFHVGISSTDEAILGYVSQSFQAFFFRLQHLSSQCK